MNPTVTADPPAPDLPDLCHSLMERSPMPMAELEGAGHVLRYVNPAFCRLVGKSTEALIGTPFADTVQAGDGCLALLERVYRTGEAETHTEPAHPESHPASWSYAMWPVLDAEHSPVGVMVQVTETAQFHQQMLAMNEALLRSAVRQHELTESAEKLNEQLQAEITVRKQAEETLARQAEELQHSNAKLERFAYIASHDLQEPLRTVSSFAQLLARRYQGKLDAKADEFISSVVGGATRMQALIQDLLTYSRLGRGEKTFADTDCETVLEQVSNALQNAIAQSGAQVTHDPLPTVWADESQLGQVFQNLMSNALKFRGPEPPRIHVAAARDGQHWLLSVRDNGIGIDPQYAERIFQVFQRLHTRKEYPGTGIGLATCKEIVELHGGRIWVESTPGQGATFYFTINQKSNQ